jgi:hypothetical protein
MRTTATVALMLVRACGLVLIVLGVLFWTGGALALVPVHMLLGLVLVLSLWTLAFLGARSGVSPALVVVGFLWGLLVPVLGVTQDQLLTGGGHWLIRALHLLVGLAAIGLAEGLGAQVKRTPAAERLAGR